MQLYLTKWYITVYYSHAETRHAYLNVKWRVLNSDYLLGFFRKPILWRKPSKQYVDRRKITYFQLPYNHAEDTAVRGRLVVLRCDAVFNGLEWETLKMDSISRKLGISLLLWETLPHTCNQPLSWPCTSDGIHTVSAIRWRMTCDHSGNHLPLA